MYRCSNCGHLLETEELLHAHMEECEECMDDEDELYSLFLR